jgi:hypothetical protein|nr:MAG TPA: hypothetical protein [Caudoviricetes sp.]
MKNKEKYNLNELAIKTTETLSGHKIKVFHKDKIIYERTYLVNKNNEDLLDFFNWLEQEYKPPILNDVEKAYLSAVIKPFRKEVKYAYKICSEIDKREYLEISLENGVISFPYFEKGTMYKGMEVKKTYTLKELGL